MIYVLDRDRRGYQESSRAEADSIVRYYRSLRGGED